MNKKIIICLTILCLVSFTACKKETTDRIYQPIIKELKWGMGEDQVIKLLNNMNDMDYKQYDYDANDDNQGNSNDGNTLLSIIELNSPIKKFGYNARVLLVFSKEGYDGLAGEGLFNCIILGYSDVTEEELLVQLKSELGDDYSENSMAPGIKSYIWKSKMTMKDIPQKTFDNVCTYLKYKSPNTSETILLPKVDEPVNHIVFGVTKSEDKTSLSVTYYSDWEWLINYLNNTTK
ncbi:MAG: hypothetical protein KIC94_14295 [Clostridiales bacterium]|nr:hypothetical protein [Clostridiales bacterium]